MSEELIIDLCYKLTENVYLPIREYIRKINMQLTELGKKTESYDFGTRIELFKAEIENGINKLSKEIAKNWLLVGFTKGLQIYRTNNRKFDPLKFFEEEWSEE